MQDEHETQFVIPMSPTRPNFTVFDNHRMNGPGIVMEVLARLGDAGESAQRIGELAEREADRVKFHRRANSFSRQVVRGYLIKSRDNGWVEMFQEAGVTKWRLSPEAHEKIKEATQLISGGPAGEGGSEGGFSLSQIRKVDGKGRIILPIKYVDQMFVVNEDAGGNLVLRRVTLNLAPMSEDISGLGKS